METIFSLVTAPINQNISIVRISGDDTFEIVNKIVKQPITKESGIQLVTLHDSKNVLIDQALLIKFVDRKSFTGEDTVEIQSHGSLIVVNKIITALASLGIRQAIKGEFTKRALLNGKLTTLQAEAINDIINAETEYAVINNVSKLINKEKTVIDNLLNNLLAIKSQLIVNIDYPEYYDVAQLSNEDIYTQLIDLSKQVDRLVKQNIAIRPQIESFKIALVGRPNVGKSSLLNYLLKKDKAIVTSVAGTTRDLVEDYFFINEHKVKIIDTAGIRNTKNKIERIGVEKSLGAIKEANLVIVLMDKKDEEGNKELLTLVKGINKNFAKVYTKNDLNKTTKPSEISISVKNNDVEKLLVLIKKYIDENAELANISNIEFVANDRQKGVLERLNLQFEKLINNLKANEQIDLVMFEIDELLSSIGELLGLKFDEEYFDKIFETFCIGK